MESIAKIISDVLIKGCVNTPKVPNALINIINSVNDGELKHATVDIITNDDSVLCFSFDLKIIKDLQTTQLIDLKWINRRTDGIIYKYANNKHNFVLIEVKTDGTGGCQNQHDSMMAFLTYLVKVVELENKISILKNVVFYRVLLTSRFPKGATNVNRGIPFNSKINANEIQYKQNESKPIPLNQFLDCKKFHLCEC